MQSTKLTNLNFLFTDFFVRFVSQCASSPCCHRVSSQQIESSRVESTANSNFLFSQILCTQLQQKKATNNNEKKNKSEQRQVSKTVIAALMRSNRISS